MGKAAPTEERIGQYRIAGEIASGGMATVHLGFYVGEAGFSRTVAIKRLHRHLAADPQFSEMLIDEARLVARIHHPNVVTTFDVVVHEGEVLVVMEYVLGEAFSTLWTLAKECGQPIPLPIVSAVLAGALEGLHAAHEMKDPTGTPLGVVHRDVSPQNLLVGVDGVARVCDFGIAKAAHRLQMTREGRLKGKLRYVPPEVLTGGAVTRQADIYAAAVVLWEALTAERFLGTDRESELYGKILEGVVHRPSRRRRDVPAELDALVMRGIAREPAERYATAADMAEALERVVEPASPRDVGAWVERIAGAAVTKREQQYVEVERTAQLASRQPQAPDAGPLEGDLRRAPLSAQAVPSSPALAAPGSEPKAWAVRVRTSTILLALGFAGGFVASRSCDRMADVSNGAEAANRAEARLEASAPEVPAASVSEAEAEATPSGTPVDDLPSLAGAHDGGSARRSSRRAVTPPTGKAPSATAAAKAAPTGAACARPTYFDANGIEHIVPGCERK